MDSIFGVDVDCNCAFTPFGARPIGGTNELYEYCVRTVKGYLTEKDVTKLEEVLSIVNQLSESWNSIEPK